MFVFELNGRQHTVEGLKPEDSVRALMEKVRMTKVVGKMMQLQLLMGDREVDAGGNGRKTLSEVGVIARSMLTVLWVASGAVYERCGLVEDGEDQRAGDESVVRVGFFGDEALLVRVTYSRYLYGANDYITRQLCDVYCGTIDDGEGAAVACTWTRRIRRVHSRRTGDSLTSHTDSGWIPRAGAIPQSWLVVDEKGGSWTRVVGATPTNDGDILGLRMHGRGQAAKACADLSFL